MRSDLDGESEVLQTGDETQDLPALGAVVEMVCAQFVVKRSVFEHVQQDKFHACVIF
jgi:hypothetical protein